MRIVFLVFLYKTRPVGVAVLCEHWTLKGDCKVTGNKEGNQKMIGPKKVNQKMEIVFNFERNPFKNYLEQKEIDHKFRS